MDGREDVKPAWLRGLLEETFFVSCDIHEDLTKHEKKLFCLQCSESLCSNCFYSHSSHPLLQVRRYVYHEVALVEDLMKLVDCSNIQPYTINAAKAVFLNQRPQARHLKGTGRKCLTCRRILQGPFGYCSLSCKVEYVVFNEGDLSGILRSFDPSEFTLAQFEGLQMGGTDNEDDGEEDLQLNGFSCSSSSTTTTRGGGFLAVPEDSKIGKEKKRSGSRGLVPNIVLHSLSRRKGAPQRSPFS